MAVKLSERLKALREEHELTQKDLADYLNMTKEGYGHYERNDREPSIDCLNKICQFYDLTLPELFDGLETTDFSYHIIAETAATNTDFANLTTGHKHGFKNSPLFENNLKHFSNLLKAKELQKDFSAITKTDLIMLWQYKKLSKQQQEDIFDFIAMKTTKTKK